MTTAPQTQKDSSSSFKLYLVFQFSDEGKGNNPLMTELNSEHLKEILDTQLDKDSHWKRWRKGFTKAPSIFRRQPLEKPQELVFVPEGETMPPYNPHIHSASYKIEGENVMWRIDHQGTTLTSMPVCIADLSKTFGVMFTQTREGR